MKVPSGTVTSAMNCAASQVPRAWAGRAVIVAAGISDNTRAASIITKPNGILDFITFSFVRPKTTMSGMNTTKPKPYFPIDCALSDVSRRTLVAEDLIAEPSGSRQSPTLKITGSSRALAIFAPRSTLGIFEVQVPVNAYFIIAKSRSLSTVHWTWCWAQFIVLDSTMHSTRILYQTAATNA